jgi:hypothetical protein
LTRLAIIGSRDWPTPEAVRAYVRSLPKDAIVITGGWWDSDGRIHPTRGVDSIAAEEANRCGLTVALVAGSSQHGKYAGLRRNPAVVELAERGMAFHDGTSPGTAGTVELFEKAGKVVEVSGPDPDAR